MTAIGRYPQKSVRELAQLAAVEALKDAGVTHSDVDQLYFSNSAQGIITGQEMIRGQVAFNSFGFDGTPLINVENACASGSTALNQAVTAIRAEVADVILVVGVEWFSHPDKSRAKTALSSGMDLESAGGGARNDVIPSRAHERESVLMDVYAEIAIDYMRDAGATARDFADVAVKNRVHASMNPLAQFRKLITADSVLASRQISGPLTLLMCSPLGDGAAALVIASEKWARSNSIRGIRIEACVLTSGMGAGEDPTTRAARQAYEAAGIGPDELDVVELHDAAAPAELVLYERLGLCGLGEGPRLLRSGATKLGGRIPVNPSGGLLSKGHPIGATGCAQIVELTQQLRGAAGGRQVPDARFGIAENGGGWLGPHPAAVAVSVLSRP